MLPDNPAMDRVATGAEPLEAFDERLGDGPTNSSA
jgi:hypothetical protein